jgi:hypothetical protein
MPVAGLVCFDHHLFRHATLETGCADAHIATITDTTTLFGSRR